MKKMIPFFLAVIASTAAFAGQDAQEVAKKTEVQQKVEEKKLVASAEEAQVDAQQKEEKKSDSCCK